MNLSDFSSVKTANKRVAPSAKGQNFTDLKFRKATGKKSGKLTSQFIVATAKFNSLGLSTNALRPFINKSNEVILAVVADADGQLLKKTTKGEKGTKFKSDTVEAALNASGVIDSNLLGANQFLKLTEVGANVTIDGVHCITAFAVSKGEKVVSAAPASTGTSNGTVSNSAAPQGEPAAKKVWD